MQSKDGHNSKILMTIKLTCDLELLTNLIKIGTILFMLSLDVKHGPLVEHGRPMSIVNR